MRAPLPSLHRPSSAALRCSFPRRMPQSGVRECHASASSSTRGEGSTSPCVASVRHEPPPRRTVVSSSFFASARRTPIPPWQADHLRQLPRSRAHYATSTTPTSSITDPAEQESQKWLEAGTAHLEAGEMEQAKAAYERSLSIRPTSSSYFNLGVVHYHNQDLASAISAWQSSLELSPESADAHTNLASAHVLSKPSRPDLAIHHLKTAAELSPSDPEIHFNLAAVLEACERLDEALSSYQRAHRGGIQRASQNIRNVLAKIGAAGAALAEQQKASPRGSDGDGGGGGGGASGKT